MRLLTFDNIAYALDLGKIIDFISETSENEKDIHTTITHMYGTDTPSMVNKEVSEVRANCNETFNKLRYDIIRTLLDVIISPPYYDGRPVTQNNRGQVTLGQMICINTFLKCGILKDISEDLIATKEDD